jgi:3-(3-hydroxy-phenyl)propionate hydroxylase
MDEVFGQGWRLVVDGRRRTAIPILKGMRIEKIVIGEGGHPEADGVAAAWFDAYGCKAALVRPDHYVYCGSPDLQTIEETWSELEGAIGVRDTASRR